MIKYKPNYSIPVSLSCPCFLPTGQEGSGSDESCDNFTDLNLSHCFMGTSLYVRLLLYTRSNLDCGREINHHHLSSQPLFNLSRPTAFVIHGYRPTGAPPIWINHIVHLLAKQEDMNVIVVDWNKGAANLNYLTAVAYTREAAYNLTGFIMTMEEEGASLSSVHLIGVSLGAHLAGFVGANLKGKIGRITGLDPAGPMFTSAIPEERLDPSDAMFVDVLHTDMNSFGLTGAHGHIDFYANGGADQPGCPKTIFAGYDVSKWRETLLRLGQTKVFFSTTATLPYRKLSYRVDMVTWNQYLRWGVVYIRLHSGRHFTETRIDHKLFRLEQYTSTRLLAQFDEELPHVQKISLRINTGNVIGPRYKIRLLRIRFTPLERPERPLMCRFDIIMEENMEVAFRPLPCDSRL
ncbi:lipase member H-A isoform X2 [Xiphias gladius]|uniref:lipase member H-A isoform X2 n=1 Tax=Xiphias gladius TaxID=8245 RepID=UPI001A9947C9|nr:lipase member H-A isoform X2 [Xiphias gladius]